MLLILPRKSILHFLYYKLLNSEFTILCLESRCRDCLRCEINNKQINQSEGRQECWLRIGPQTMYSSSICMVVYGHAFQSRIVKAKFWLFNNEVLDVSCVWGGQSIAYLLLIYFYKVYHVQECKRCKMYLQHIMQKCVYILTYMTHISRPPSSWLGYK